MPLKILPRVDIELILEPMLTSDSFTGPRTRTFERIKTLLDTQDYHLCDGT